MRRIYLKDNDILTAIADYVYVGGEIRLSKWQEDIDTKEFFYYDPEMDDSYPVKKDNVDRLYYEKEDAGKQQGTTTWGQEFSDPFGIGSKLDSPQK